MFGLGFSEILILGLVAFLVFGPKQFPVIAKEFLNLFNDLKKSFSNIKEDISGIETEVQKQIHQVTSDIEKAGGFVKDIEKEDDSTKEQEKLSSKPDRETEDREQS